MAKKAAKPEPKKHQLKVAEIQSMVDRWQEIEEEMAPLVEELAGIKSTLVADMDPKDAYEFDSVTLRCIQSKRRKGLEWRKIAFGLAKLLYPTVDNYRAWLKTIVRKHPYEPTKPYVQLYVAKEKA